MPQDAWRKEAWRKQAHSQGYDKQKEREAAPDAATKWLHKNEGKSTARSAKQKRRAEKRRRRQERKIQAIQIGLTAFALASRYGLCLYAKGDTWIFHRNGLTILEYYADIRRWRAPDGRSGIANTSLEALQGFLARVEADRRERGQLSGQEPPMR